MSVALSILASVLGIVATWFLNKQIRKWLQARRNKKQIKEVAEAREDAQRQNQSANEESDRLKEIDGR